MMMATPTPQDLAVLDMASNRNSHTDRYITCMLEMLLFTKFVMRLI